MNRLRPLICLLFMLAAAAPLSAANEHYNALQSFFERATRARYENQFRGLESRADWETRRAQVRAGLDRMLGFDRTWPQEPPKVQITHRVERPDYTLECLVLETAPGLYCTANLYLPARGEKPYPFIIYQSGHSFNDPYGNKSEFKHHGAWFAARGIAVLITDTIEMGEIKVTHHGPYSYQWYDWYSRGYSPLSPEIFNARRAIDYLSTRPELDSGRIGATGISGGGVCTFFLVISDDRVTAAAPVSGECSTLGHVEGRLAVLHCDCMYHVNGSDLTFSELGALAAPRPVLMCNATADPLYPMKYFNQLVDKMREVYKLHGASDRLSVATAPGGHADSEAIRLPVYEFFLREFLGRDERITVHGAVDTLPDAELLCLREGYPLDERLTRVHEDFMPRRGTTIPENWSLAARQARRTEVISHLRAEVFAAMPVEQTKPAPSLGPVESMWGRDLRSVTFQSFPELTVTGALSLPVNTTPGKKLPGILVVEDGRGPTRAWSGRTDTRAYAWGERAVLSIEPLDTRSRTLDDSLVHQMRRTAALAGFSFDGIRVWEIMQGLQVLRSLDGVDPDRVSLVGRGEMGINALYAALLDGKVERVALESPPASHLDGPYYLQVLTVTDIPEVIALMADKVRLYGSVPEDIVRAVGRVVPPVGVKRANLADCLD